MSAYELCDKVALVTGAARGIGFETARALHERGATVALVDLDRSATQHAAQQVGGRAIGLGADVTERDAMHAVVSETVKRLGRLDVVVANAGIAPKPMTLAATDPDVVDRVIDVNLLGVYRTVQPALPHVLANRGHVVVVASVYAFVNGVLVAPYAMAKAGVEQYGRALRAELAQHGASATVAYFGFIDTAMVHDAFADPLAQRFEATLPRALRRRLPPSAAATAIAVGIERRSPRVIAPKRWATVSLLRGALNPIIDRYAEHNRAIQTVIGDIERSAP
ncbi:MAG TPA: short-chain dehydrogenase/reductase [Solirubrobacteraceae bacterium]|jgi:NAD(P)-dependent dehydrogenase (short-subunit alcohol dehydrogenase family)|nr:short-chain dehydrogenase/reductase [Solirubrobacteraceae bacterium]